MECDTGPVFRFAEKLADLPEAQLAENPQGEHFLVGLRQFVEQPVEMKQIFLLEIFIVCILDMQKNKVGKQKL